MPLRSSTATRTCHLEDNAGLGLIHNGTVIDPVMSPSKDIPYNLVDVHNLTATGARIVHHCTVDTGTKLGFMAYDRQVREWKSFQARVAYCDGLPDQGGCCVCGLEFFPAAPEPSTATSKLEFLVNTPLFASVPQRALLHLINCLRRHLPHLKAYWQYRCDSFYFFF